MVSMGAGWLRSLSISRLTSRNPLRFTVGYLAIHRSDSGRYTCDPPHSPNYVLAWQLCHPNTVTHSHGRCCMGGVARDQYNKKGFLHV